MRKPKTAIEKIDWLEKQRMIGRFRCVEDFEDDDLSTLLAQIKTLLLKDKKKHA